MMTEVKDKKWYVVRAISGQENKIKTYIEEEIKRLKIDSFVDDIIVPTQKVIQIRNGKKVSKEKVYFPGYIMIKANLTGEIPHIIRSFPNILGFLGETKGGDPIPLRSNEVSRMLGKVDELSIKNNLRNPIHILTGHTSSDNAETFLMNLARGSNYSGLSGIQRKRFLSKYQNICNF